MCIRDSYNIVDQIFIANASYLGSYGNAANTVVFPLTVVALAIAVMIGDGCCAFVSISLGKGEVGEARKSVEMCIRDRTGSIAPTGAIQKAIRRGRGGAQPHRRAARQIHRR